MAEDAANANSFVNPLPGVPNVESMFFERLFAGKDLSPDTVRIARDLHDRGYAVLDFPDPDFDARSKHIIQHLKPQFNFDAWRQNLWPLGQGLRIQDAWQSDKDVAAIASNEAILNLLTLLYGRRAFPFQTLNFPVGTQQAFHTDSVHFSSIPERFMCGVWVAFEDIDDDNGPLEYFPGSHKLPIYVNEHINACSVKQTRPDEHYSSFIRLWREIVAEMRYERDRFHARKGQALIWTSNLLHGGSKQNDPMRTRWSQVTHYYFHGCTYYTPLLSDPAYGKTYYREMTDIGTGQRIPNTYAGHLVDPGVIQQAMPAYAQRTKPAADNTLPADFDPRLYLLANPDVAAAGRDAVHHWKTHGWKEGRRLRP